MEGGTPGRAFCSVGEVFAVPCVAVAVEVREEEFDEAGGMERAFGGFGERKSGGAVGIVRPVPRGEKLRCGQQEAEEVCEENRR